MSKPAWITDAVIANSKRIHELGGRLEVIREGSWIIVREEDRKSGYSPPKLVLNDITFDERWEGKFTTHKHNIIPIW
jgi:hypothetical protein